jgi:hypothetical protein
VELLLPCLLTEPLPWNGTCFLYYFRGKIPLATPRGVAEEIRTNLNPKKAPGFDLITGEILKNFKRNAWSN